MLPFFAVGWGPVAKITRIAEGEPGMGATVVGIPVNGAEEHIARLAIRRFRVLVDESEAPEAVFPG